MQHTSGNQAHSSTQHGQPAAETQGPQDRTRLILARREKFPMREWAVADGLLAIVIPILVSHKVIC